MGKGTKTTTQQQARQTNNYGEFTPTDSPDSIALREYKPATDPRISYAYGAAKNRLRGNLSNVLGGNYSPTEQDQILGAADANLGQQEAADLSAESFQNNQLDLRRKEFLANLMQKKLVQTGGTSSGTSTTKENPGWGKVLGQVVGVGLDLA